MQVLDENLGIRHIGSRTSRRASSSAGLEKLEERRQLLEGRI